MCLLLVGEKEFPSRELLQAGERSNPDGAGIAWIQNGRVFWEKGLAAKELFEFKEFGPPWVIHFRRATVGKALNELCHPFVTDENASTAVSGSTDKGILAHNGNWIGWHSGLMEQVNNGIALPDGMWSDSRALAWMTGMYGDEFLKKTCSTDKIAWMTPDSKENGVIRYGHWGLEDKVNKIYGSYNPNSHWVWTYDNEYGYGRSRTYRSVSSSKIRFKTKTYKNFDDYLEHRVKNNIKELNEYEKWKKKIQGRELEKKGAAEAVGLG